MERNPLERLKLLRNIDLSQVYLFVIVYCIYTPTGKREDLWDARIKRPSVFKCLSAYICQEC